MSGIIPKESLGGFQRWQVGDFTTRPTTPTAAAPVISETPENADSGLVVNDVPLPTAEDIEQIHEQARAEGYQAGYAEGQQAARDEAAALIADTGTRMAEMIGHLQVALAYMDQEIADQVLDLALEVSAQVIRGSISAKRDTLLPVIREALAALPLHHGHVALHLNPADAEAVREQMGEQLAQTGTQIITDATITAGGCTLRAGASEVDATLETRWKRVIEAIGIEPKDWLETP
ncbi:MAG: flagellar assembly protein FliH [Dechloromonas sp.]|nr:MAG: flagellar assembly protein FliH [Dechloromonas sp.]